LIAPEEFLIYSRCMIKTPYFFISLILIALAGLAACSSLQVPRASPADPLAMTPEEVVEGFYNWYLEYPGNPMSDGAFKLSPFLDEALIAAKEEELSLFNMGGADVFLCAQDIPEKIYVQPAQIDGSRASVKVNSSFEGHSIEVELELREGEWKITRVHCRR
jgi:hypothetical protein